MSTHTCTFLPHTESWRQLHGITVLVFGHFSCEWPPLQHGPHVTCPPSGKQTGTQAHRHTGRQKDKTGTDTALADEQSKWVEQEQECESQWSFSLWCQTHMGLSLCVNERIEKDLCGSHCCHLIVTSMVEHDDNQRHGRWQRRR